MKLATEPQKDHGIGTTARVGIIAGSGVGDILLNEAGGQTVNLTTPFGSPSTPPIIAHWEGVDVVFIARHGIGHALSPSRVPYRANIWAMKQLGVNAILASGATGSLREDIKPGHLVICDQVIDRTYRRAGTFFDEGPVVHVEFSDPFCPCLRGSLIRAAKYLDSSVHEAGTYVCMEGPQLSTRAESNMHRVWGGDLIGMTCLPEAKLAREAEICYALIAFATDYDCWRAATALTGGVALLAEIRSNVEHASRNAIALIRAALKRNELGDGECPCGSALAQAIWSDRTRIDSRVWQRCALLLGKYTPADGRNDVKERCERRPEIREVVSYSAFRGNDD